jgi:Na+/H+ antiporter NhaA
MSAKAVTEGEPEAKGAAPPAPPPSEADGRRQAARMLTYRMVPLWIFFLVFGVTLVWEAAVRGNPITSEKLQAAALVALVFALFIGAPIGIRFFNPLPPKT